MVSIEFFYLDLFFFNFYFSLQLEAVRVSVGVHPLPAVHLGDAAQLWIHPGPGGRVHRDPAHLCLPPPLLHEAGRHVLTESKLETEVKQKRNKKEFKANCESQDNL